MESDSQEAIDLLKTVDLVTHADLFLIRECQKMLHQPGMEFVLVKVHQNTNMAADKLAQLAHGRPGTSCNFISPPQEVLDLITADFPPSINHVN